MAYLNSKGVTITDSEALMEQWAGRPVTKLDGTAALLYEAAALVAAEDELPGHGEIQP